MIEFARSNLAIAWSRDYASLLELAEACDVPVRWSCRTGVCHTCETTLIAGSIGYDPDPVEPPAEGSVLICCSQPRGPGARSVTEGGRGPAGVSRRSSGEVGDDHVAEHRAVVLAPLGVGQVAVEDASPNVCRLATRNTQNALIIMWRSIGSTSRANAPDAGRARGSCAIRSIAGLLRRAKLSDRAICSARWMFSMLTRRMKSGLRLVVVEGQLG